MSWLKIVYWSIGIICALCGHTVKNDDITKMCYGTAILVALTLIMLEYI